MSKISLIVLLLISLLFRLYGIEDNSLWLDEFTSIDIASKSITDIVTGNGFDSHTPPFYYLLLHFWLKILGQSEMALRSFSVFFDLINVLLVYFVSLELLKNEKVSLATTSLYAISPFAVFYAQDGRMYTLLTTLCLLTSLMLLRFPFASIGKSLLFLFVAIVGMYTHYYYALFLASISLYLVFFSKNSFENKKKYCYHAIIIGVAFLPWLQVIKKLMSGPGQTFREYVWSVVPYAFFRFSAGYGIFTLNTSAKSNIKETIFANIGVIAVYYVLFGLAIILGARCIKKNFSESFSFIFLALLGPLTLAVIISIFTPMLSERYLVVSYPFFLMVIASLIMSDKTKPIFFICMTLLLFGLSRHIKNPLLSNTEWKGASEVVLNSKYKCNNIFVNPPHAEGITDFYLPEEKSFFNKKTFFSNDSLECVWLFERGTSKSLVKEFETKNYQLVFDRHFPYENELYLRLLRK